MDRGGDLVSSGAEALGDVLEYRFRDAVLAETALSHPSHAHELDGSRGNERLEFLGDAVLDLAMAEILYERHADWTEGALTRARAALVNKSALARVARRLGLGELVRLGRTEHRTGGGDKDSILANCLEAVIGALYLDGGLEPVYAFVERVFAQSLEDGEASRDAKTAFQEWAHARHRKTPGYRLVADSGVENDERRFTVEVSIGDETYGRGVGRTKRAAERSAAESGLERGRGK
jgi:ribonuclease-3